MLKIFIVCEQNEIDLTTIVTVGYQYYRQLSKHLFNKSSPTTIIQIIPFIVKTLEDIVQDIKIKANHLTQQNNIITIRDITDCWNLSQRVNHVWAQTISKKEWGDKQWLVGVILCWTW